MVAPRARETGKPVEIPAPEPFLAVRLPAPGPMDDGIDVHAPLDLLRGCARAIDSPEVAPGVRELIGRSMAGSAREKGVDAAMRAFAALHLGTLERVSKAAGRHVFESRDLHSVTSTGSRQPTCHLALGFAEGLVEAEAGGLALGNEVACRSRGDDVCRFVVRSTIG